MSEHSTLTGASLHEPKGVAAASADRVYVSDGLGSGAWSKLPSAAIDGLANPFGAQLLHVREEQVSGTDGGTATGLVWNTRTLNTVKTNEITSASLAANQITLPAGTYFIDAHCPCYAIQRSVAKLYNVTDASDTLIGTAVYAYPSEVLTPVKGRFTIAGTKVFELRQYATNGIGLDGLGVAGNIIGTIEVYSEVLIWKIA